MIELNGSRVSRYRYDQINTFDKEREEYGILASRFSALRSRSEADIEFDLRGPGTRRQTDTHAKFHSRKRHVRA